MIYEEVPPEKAVGIPLVEVDKTVEEETYIVTAWKFGQSYIYRYNRHKAIFLFGPYNRIRRLAIVILTHVCFEILMMTVVLANCTSLVLPELVPVGIDALYTLFYLAETLLQTIARGFIMGTYAYLHNPWHFLDFVITMISFAMLTTSNFISGLDKIPEIEALRGIRAMKAITTIPGVQTMAQGMLLSMRRMTGVSIIMLLFLTTFTLLGKQLYMGVLLYKCVRIPPQNLSAYNNSYRAFINDVKNWQPEEEGPIICGNTTGAVTCKEGFMCLPDIGHNPSHGYSNFDNFGWAFINTFRLFTLDAWEELYNEIMQATGPVSILYFIPIIFFGSFYLLNLMLAVVSSSYVTVLAESNDQNRVLSDYRIHNVFRFDFKRLPLFRLPADPVILKKVIQQRDREMVSRSSSVFISKGWKQIKEMVLRDELSALRTDEIIYDKQPSEECEKLIEEVPKEELGCWAKLRQTARIVTESRCFRYFIFTCIVANTVLLASEHYGMTANFRKIMQNANLVLTVCFVVEELLDLTAYGKSYFYDWWNILDIVIVGESLISLVLENVAEITPARSLRLLRLAKLSNSWTTLRKVITVILNSVVNIIKLFVVVVVMVFVFAVMGVRLLGQNYSTEVFKPDPPPRWSFATFPPSVFVVFRILAGEWVETLWDCMRGENIPLKCPILIFSYFVAGNFVILNLFIALLLSTFDSADLQFSNVEQESGLKRNFQLFYEKFSNFFKKKNLVEDEKIEKPELKEIKIVKLPHDESPKLYMPKRRWQRFFYVIVQSTVFQCIISIMIFGSCITLSFEDASLPQKKTLFRIIGILNLFFTVIFTIEMILKWLGLGFKKYFSDGWAMFDFIVVMVALTEIVIVNLFVQGTFRLGALKALRALRPLRFIPRWKSMQMVVTALLMSLPAMFRVILVCMFIWLTFAIFGVHLFAGRLFRCVNQWGEIMSYKIIPNKTVCLQENLTWSSPSINFDNIGNSYLALFQLAMFTGWVPIVEMMVDITKEDEQPRPNASPIYYIYYACFILVGGFLTLNLFVGVVVDTFKDMKKHVESGVVELFLTESQRKYYKAMQKLGRKKPVRVVRSPSIPLMKFCYRIARSRKFQITMITIICCNALTIAVESYKGSQMIYKVINILDGVFQVIYTVEFLIKFLGLRKFYFRDPWNVFDFILWFSNSIGAIVEMQFHKAVPMQLSMIYTFRLLRIFRLLRLAKSAGDIRRLLYALLASAPALFNISVLLSLLIFIYSVMGVSFFAFVKHNGAITENVNFETLGNSALLLFRLTSAAGWETILEALSISPPKCDATYNNTTVSYGNCGNNLLAISFLLSFILLSNIILVNIFVAIILDSYEDAIAEEEELVNEENLDAFYACWAHYDPKATQFLDFGSLSDFLDALEEPLRISKPNSAAIAVMNLQVTNENKVHCLNVLQGILKLDIGEVEESSEFNNLYKKMKDNILQLFPGLKKTRVVATTLELKREDFAARVIQRAVRAHRAGKQIRRKREIRKSVFEQEMKILSHFVFEF